VINYNDNLFSWVDRELVSPSIPEASNRKEFAHSHSTASPGGKLGIRVANDVWITQLAHAPANRGISNSNTGSDRSDNR
jgi:hypothetical protein